MRFYAEAAIRYAAVNPSNLKSIYLEGAESSRESGHLRDFYSELFQKRSIDLEGVGAVFYIVGSLRIFSIVDVDSLMLTHVAEEMNGGPVDRVVQDFLI